VNGEAKRGSDWSATTVGALAILTLISSLNYLDRSLLGLAMPAIQAEMTMSDTMLGIVSGVVFVLFYSTLGVPMAWLADRWNRRNIIAIGLAFWSLMTFATGWVTNLWQLAVTRFLMGAGEACGLAPSNSMLGDLFGKASRPLALAIFGTASSIAFAVFYPLMGLVCDTFGWRAMFFSAGLPGVVLALIFVRAVREPVRGAAEESQARVIDEPVSFGRTLATLLQSRAYLLLLAGAAFMGAVVYATSIWSPTFLMRVHHLTTAEAASSIGPMRGVIGGFGVLLGGVLTDLLGRRDERWRLRVPAIACLLTAPAEALFLLGGASSTWAPGFGLASFLTLLHQAPIFAAVISVTPVRMRALAISLLVLSSGLVGQALGPLFIGVMSDHLNPQFGVQAIRYALLSLPVCAALAGLCFWGAGRVASREPRETLAPRTA
jgi:MFS family permease